MWLFGSLLALLGGLLLVSVAAFATLGVTIWAIVDACRHPEAAWSRIGQNRLLWVALLIAGWLVTGVERRAPHLRRTAATPRRGLRRPHRRRPGAVPA